MPEIRSQNVTGSSESEYHVQAAPFLFLFVSFLLGVLVRVILKRLRSVRLPYTVVLFIFGVLFGLLSNSYESVRPYTSLARMPPKIFLHIFLPILIFESAFAMDSHTFIRCFWQCIILAVPGLLICSGLTAFLSYNLFVAYKWNWNNSFLFGSILSATDPVAVVALLRDVGTSKILTTLIEGEALLNDGSAIVIYDVLIELLVPGVSMTAADIILKFCRITLGGPLLGYVLGKLSVFSLSRVFNDAVIEITITLCSAYLTYYLAEIVLEVSGVLAVVTLGVVISAHKVSISPEVEEFVHSFWEMLSYLANTLIFFIVGVVITERAIVYIDNTDLFLILIVYIGITVFRLVMIGFLSPVLTRLGYGLKWQDAVIMTWGGLRGAVGMALALSVAENEFVSKETIGHKILIHVSGIVILTLLVNATTTNLLLSALGMNAVSPWKKANMASAVQHLKEVHHRALHVHKNDMFLADADWKSVEKRTEILDPYNRALWKKKAKKGIEENDPLTSFSLSRPQLCPECSSQHLCQPSSKEKEEMFNEARLRMIAAQKVNYARQYESGLLLRESVEVLMAAADVVADKPGTCITVDELRKNWEIGGLLRFMQDNFVNPLRSQEDYSKMNGAKAPVTCRRHVFRLVHHPAFEFLVRMIFVTDVAISIAETVLRLNGCNLCRSVTILRWIDIAFVLFYVVETILKLTGLGCAGYFQNKWNRVDFIVLWLSLICAGTELQIEIFHLWESPYIVLMRFCRLLRIVYVKRLAYIFMPLGNKIADYVNFCVNEQLTAGYDIGRGFMMGEGEVLKILDRAVNYQPIAEPLRKICVENRLTIVRELAQLQEKYPNVATAVKTRRAVRHVLNSLRDELKELKEAGLLDDSVFNVLNEVVHHKMKRLRYYAPATIVPAPPLEIFKNIDWIEGSEEVFIYLKNKAKLKNFHQGWELGKVGDPPNGIYLILFGVVKVEGEATEREDGSVPNTDSYQWFHSKGQMKDLLTVGSVIGELGVLTKRSKDTAAVCETDVRAFHISQQDMLDCLEHFRDFPSLEYKMWRSCALRIARCLLSKHPKFESWTPDKIMMHLEQAQIPDLSEVTTFLLTPNMLDVIMVQGQAYDTHTTEIYCGATYLPKRVHSITFKKSNNDRPILVIIGNENFTLEPGQDWSGSDLVPANSNSLCLLHNVRRRMSGMSQPGEDSPRTRSWSDGIRMRFLSERRSLRSVKTNSAPMNLRRSSATCYLERISGVDNPSFIPDSPDLNEKAQDDLETNQQEVQEEQLTQGQAVNSSHDVRVSIPETDEISRI